MLTEVNTDTALNPENAIGEGQILKFSVVSPSGLTSLTPNNTWLDMGWLPDGTYVLPNVEIDSASLMAAGRENGQSVEIATRTKSSKMGYEIPLLTADDRTRTIHKGTPAVVGTTGELAGIRAYKINRGAVVLGRFIFIKKRANGSWTVTFHPRFELSNNNKERGDADNEILKFVGSVRSYNYVPSAEVAQFGPAIDDFGVDFEGDTPEELDALLTALDREALPTATLLNAQATAGMSGAAGSVTAYTLNITRASNVDIVTTGGTGNVDVRIKNATGAVVAQGNNTDNAEDVTALALAAGTYTVELVGTTAYDGVTLTPTITPA